MPAAYPLTEVRAIAPRVVTKPVMKKKLRRFRSGKTFWCEDTENGRQQTLGTKNKADAVRLLHGRNEAHAVPLVNLQMARAYMMAADPKAPTRTWQDVFGEIIKVTHGETERWARGIDPDTRFGRGGPWRRRRSAWWHRNGRWSPRPARPCCSWSWRRRLRDRWS
jgi:hypothetical protein